MKNLKLTVVALLFGIAFTLPTHAQKLRSEVFSLLNLNYPGLEKVKTYYQQGDTAQAAEALLSYYRTRTNIHHPDLDLSNLRISATEQKWADEAMEHTFFVHYGYQPSFNYGKEIDWCYWPVQDNELRWQLHRHKWFVPMGKAYRLSKDEKYAKEWTYQYMDWIKKNPLVQIEKELYELVSAGEVKANAENVRFAWRPLETSHRVQDQTVQFMLFLPSASFTPEFLTQFLSNYHKHAVHLGNNYSDQGNHLLFEAQRMIYAGAFFPEFKDAATWRKSGMDILNREIQVQVYEDGGQYELDPHYHLASINIFCKALSMADVNGFRNEFSPEYLKTIEAMIMFYMNICFPDYTNPCFSDAKKGEKKEEMGNYRTWQKLFPANEQIRYFATDGKEGKCPVNLSKGFLKTGFFTFRNGWKQDATMMVVKAGPKGEWHCQPDNGTFELWVNGRNLFPDSGSYVYAGEKKIMDLRNWFRQTKVHNTLTLNGQNLETTESVTKLWQPEGNIQLLVTENPSYKELKHRRSVFFVNNQYFVIVDEAVGAAKGDIALNYQLCEGKVEVNAQTLTLNTHYEGNSNVKLQCFAPANASLKQEEGWRSNSYMQRTERTAVSIQANKSNEAPVRYITIVYPTENSDKAPKLSARFKKNYDERALDIEVTIDGKKQALNYKL